jgi:shikimate kinase
MIFLVGMPASGKSYWGANISQAMQLPLADLDELIVKEERASIPEIFEQKGADYFREKEHAILKHIIATYPNETIVACGGGTPVHHNNMALMKERGGIIYLDTDIDTLFQRLENDDTRPLITDTDKYEKLKALFTEREAVYKQAHYILQAEDLSLPTFAKIIQQCTDLH